MSLIIGFFGKVWKITNEKGEMKAMKEIGWKYEGNENVLRILREITIQR